MKHKMKLVSCVGTSILALCLPLAAQTMPKMAGSPSAAPSATASTSPNKQTNRPFPFHGMVSAVDQKNKTFTISSKENTRVFKVTEKTMITKGAATATMKDIVENQEISGSYWKDPDGTVEAKIVKLGPTEKKPAAKISPEITAVPKSSPAKQ